MLPGGAGRAAPALLRPSRAACRTNRGRATLGNRTPRGTAQLVVYLRTLIGGFQVPDLPVLCAAAQHEISGGCSEAPVTRALRFQTAMDLRGRLATRYAAPSFKHKAAM